MYTLQKTTNKDKFKSYTELAKKFQKDVDYSIEFKSIKDSKFLIAAPHGKSIEAKTQVIAKEIAQDKFSHYCFNGLKKGFGKELHITSINFDEPNFLKLAAKHEIIITIHGNKSLREIIYIGGLNKDLKLKIAKSFRDELGIKVVLPKPGKRFAGTVHKNICNRGISGTGVQIEISKFIRLKCGRDEEYLRKFCKVIRNNLV